MKLVVGLGNPGRIYAFTRHNLGFRVINRLAKQLDINVRKRGYSSLRGVCKIGQESVILAKPQTFMNLAGIAVAEILRDNDISPSDLIVCHDDIDLPLGKLRIKEGGGFGGHKGVKSLIESLQTDRFVRVKIGVGRPLFPVDVSEYVLGEFSDKEKGVIRMAILRAADAVLMIIKRGVAAAMNHFNVYREG